MAVKYSKKLKTKGLSKLLEDKLHKSGVACIVKETEDTKHGRRRNEVSRAHGFRKFVVTNMVRSKLSPEAREMLLGHMIGITNAYYKPNEDELLPTRYKN